MAALFFIAEANPPADGCGAKAINKLSPGERAEMKALLAEMNMHKCPARIHATHLLSYVIVPKSIDIARAA